MVETLPVHGTCAERGLRLDHQHTSAAGRGPAQGASVCGQLVAENPDRVHDTFFLADPSGIRCGAVLPMMTLFHLPRTDEDATVSVSPPHTISRPIMLQEWRNVAFLHWQADPDRVRQLIPADLEVDTFDGSAWVGLIGFEMVGVRLGKGPRIPYLGTFPETNVRTYVRDRSGRPGVWFHSLEASRLLPVMTARGTYSLPYMWASMGITSVNETIRYATSRRWPAPSGAGGVMTIRHEPEPTTTDPLAAFLTARWGLYSTSPRGDLRYAPVEHPPWILHRAETVHLQDTLLQAAGYPEPSGEAHVLWSPGVPVRIGVPRRVD